MSVVIDARLYGVEHRGLGRYVTQLITALAAQDTTTPYTLLLNPKNQSQPQDLPANFSIKAAPWRAYSLGEQFGLASLLRKLKPSLVHFPHFNVPMVVPRPYVVTIHDLILHQFASERATTLPKPLYWGKVAAYRMIIRRALQGAKQIITVSQAVADDVASFYPFAKNKLVVIPLAPAPFPSAAPLSLPKMYWLVVGAAYPHKNLELVVQALRLARHTEPELRLIVVGRRDVFMERLERWVATQGMEQAVMFWGQASEAELVSLYSATALYLLPSFAEGFGLGAVEALQQGAPVAAADIPVLHEVLGKAAVFFDPHSPEQVLQAWQAVERPELRATLHTEASAILAKLSWQEVAKKTRAVYQQAQQS